VALIRFGHFALDAESGTLTRNGVPVRLPPQPARVLALLVARAGEIVSRDELRQQIWGSETFVDFERGLNFCIAQIRAALGDSADSPRFIETLPKRGYRFIAPVTPAAEPAVPVRVDTPQPARALSRRGLTVAALLLLVIAASIAGLAMRSHPDPRIRIAVVPFDNETGDTEYDRIAGGVADATVARLATPERLQNVAVIGNAAVLRRPRAFRDLEAIGQELGAHFVVLAQVKSDDTRVRLVAHLIRVSDQAHVWAHTYDRESFGLDAQDELAESIARAVIEHAR
jgi:DNA-binding winged helix-turn-helix (wHTH) protein/TolB-like protein